MQRGPGKIPVEDWDVIVVGAGLAGLYVALKAAGSGKRILLIAKADLDQSNTHQAQGGIAASISGQDSPRLHLEDTLVAGAGLCDPQAVKMLVEDGPRRIAELIALGVQFDQDSEGLALTREGAHSRRRILHARGDSTGKVIREVLTERISGYTNITLRINTFALDLVVENGCCQGVLCLDQNGKLEYYRAPATVIASGGACQMFANTTNPAGATGDGIAMAWRAGAVLKDMEFIQFHPTALWLDGAPRFLISEAVRGEGAQLLNCRKERFMPNYHPQAELAPRDVVARAMVREMEKTGTEHVYLDFSPLKDKNIAERFPTIYSKCRQYGLELPDDLVPVAPAAHYFIGGIATDARGQTNIPGLYACGEASCTGIHGANRLASNSLLEALVYGERIALAVTQCNGKRPEGVNLPPWQCPRPEPNKIALVRETMWRLVGLQREQAGLIRALDMLSALIAQYQAVPYLCRDTMELVNMTTLARLVTWAALLRRESRGGHFRRDYPNSDQSQVGHWLFQVGAEPYFARLKE